MIILVKINISQLEYLNMDFGIAEPENIQKVNKPTDKCNGINKDGTKCNYTGSYRINNKIYCGRHKLQGDSNNTKISSQDKKSHQCAGINKRANKQCGLKGNFEYINGKYWCHHHKDQAYERKKQYNRYRYNFEDAKVLGHVLAPLISKDRSRSMDTFLTIGRCFHQIYEDDTEGLDLWRSTSIDEIKISCDEYWPTLHVEQSKEKIRLAAIDVVFRILLKDNNYTLDQVIGYLEDVYDQHVETMEEAIEFICTKSNSLKYIPIYSIYTLLDIAHIDSGRSLTSIHTEFEVKKYDIKPKQFGKEKWNNIMFDCSNAKFTKIEFDNIIRRMGRCIAVTNDKSKLIYTWEENGSSEENDCKTYKYYDYDSFCKKLSYSCKFKIDGEQCDMGMIINKYHHLFMYSNVTFFTGVTDIKKLNLFTGYRCSEYNIVPYNIEQLQPIIELGLDLHNGNENDFLWSKQWIKYVLTNTNKPGIVPFYIGSNGVGKSTWTKIIGEYLIGNRYTFNAAIASDITKENNFQISCKRLVCINEVHSDSKHDHERLKHLVDGKTIPIKKLYADVKEEKSYHAFIFCSNYDNHKWLERNDRRFFIVKSSDKWANNCKEGTIIYNQRQKEIKEHYDKVYKCINLYMNEFYSYIMDTPMDSFDYGKAPMTSMKRKIILNNMSNVERFFIDDNYKIRMEVLNYKQTEFIPCNCLYEMYKQYCESISESYWTQQNFKNEGIKHKFIIDYAEDNRMMIDNKQQRVYKLNMNMFMESNEQKKYKYNKDIIMGKLLLDRDYMKSLYNIIDQKKLSEEEACLCIVTEINKEVDNKYNHIDNTI